MFSLLNKLHFYLLLFLLLTAIHVFFLYQAFIKALLKVGVNDYYFLIIENEPKL